MIKSMVMVIVAMGIASAVATSAMAQTGKGSVAKPGKPAGFMDYTDDACMDRVKGSAPKKACRK